MGKNETSKALESGYIVCQTMLNYISNVISSSYEDDVSKEDLKLQEKCKQFISWYKKKEMENTIETLASLGVDKLQTILLKLRGELFEFDYASTAYQLAQSLYDYCDRHNIDVKSVIKSLY